MSKGNLKGRAGLIDAREYAVAGVAGDWERGLIYGAMPSREKPSVGGVLKRLLVGHGEDKGPEPLRTRGQTMLAVGSSAEQHSEATSCLAIPNVLGWGPHYRLDPMCELRSLVGPHNVVVSDPRFEVEAVCAQAIRDRGTEVVRVGVAEGCAALNPLAAIRLEDGDLLNGCQELFAHFGQGFAASDNGGGNLLAVGAEPYLAAGGEPPMAAAIRLMRDAALGPDIVPECRPAHRRTMALHMLALVAARRLREHADGGCYKLPHLAAVADLAYRALAPKSAYLEECCTILGLHGDVSAALRAGLTAKDAIRKEVRDELRALTAALRDEAVAAAFGGDGKVLDKVALGEASVFVGVPDALNAEQPWMRRVMLWSLLKASERSGRDAWTLFVVPDLQNAVVPLLARALAYGLPGCAVLATVPSLQALRGAYGRAVADDITRSVQALTWMGTATPAQTDRADAEVFSRLAGDEPGDPRRFGSSGGPMGVNMGLSHRPVLSADYIAGMGRDSVRMIPRVGDLVTGDKTPVLARVAQYKAVPELNGFAGPNPFTQPLQAAAA